MVRPSGSGKYFSYHWWSAIPIRAKILPFYCNFRIREYIYYVSIEKSPLWGSGKDFSHLWWSAIPIRAKILPFYSNFRIREYIFYVSIEKSPLWGRGKDFSSLWVVRHSGWGQDFSSPFWWYRIPIKAKNFTSIKYLD